MDAVPELVEQVEQELKGTDPIKDWDALGYLRKRVPQAQYARRSFDRGFYRNCLFYLGQQWIRYSRSAQQWRPIAVPDWFPKQVTNLFAICVDVMTSVLLQSDPQSIFSPASPEPADVAAAEAAADVSKLIDQEVGQSELESRGAKWDALVGNFFVIDGYDMDEKHGTRFVPDYACLECLRHVPADEVSEGAGGVVGGGACPHCGGSTLIEARDENGEPMGKEVSIGRQFSEVASPFEMHFDLVSGTADLENSPYIYRARTYPIDELKAMFPDHKDAIKPDDAGIDSGMFYQTALAYITNGSTSTPGNYAGAVGSVDNVPRATLYHLWVRPTPELPRGAEALICGNAVLWKGELSYDDEQGNPFIPIVHIGFNTVPGRVLCKTPADDLVFKQVQQNKMEAFIQLAMERTSNPTWLLPKGSGINNITGEPGEKIWYSALAGLKPERVGGSEIPGSVFRWLGTIADQIKELSHTQDVMRGKPPEGVPTLGGTQLLLERSLAGYADALKSWGRGWNKVRRNRLNIFRQYGSDERTMMVLGPNRKWEAKKFTKDAIAGRINVYLEEASVAPKSKAYEQLITAQLIDKGLVDMSDPMVRVQVMNTFDKGDLVQGLDIDIKDAAREQEDFTRSGHARFRPQVDNNAVHLLAHKKFAKSDEFFALPPQAQAIWLAHIQETQQAVAQEQQAAAQNDPHMVNAKAKMLEAQVELDAIQKSKAIELQHRAAMKDVDLRAHGIKKGVDIALNAAKPRAAASPSAGAPNA